MTECKFCRYEIDSKEIYHPICFKHNEKIKGFLGLQGKPSHQLKIMYRIREFYNFLNQNYPGILSVWTLNSEDYEKYFNFINAKAISKNNKLRFHNNLFKYLKYLKRSEKPENISVVDLEEIFDIDFVNYLDDATIREETPISRIEINDILHYFRSNYEDYILFSLLAYSGMRIGAAMSVTIKRVDLTKRKISTIDKSTRHFGKNDYIIPAKFVNELESYIIEIQRLDPNREKLFNLEDKSYRLHLKKWAKDYELRTKKKIDIHPHLFRDALNTMLKENKMQEEDRCLILCQMARGVNQASYLKKYRDFKFRRELYDQFSPFK